MTFEASVGMRCDCGADFELSARRAREHRNRGTSPRCPTCRGLGKPPDPKQLERMRAWWLARFSLEELRSWPSL